MIQTAQDLLRTTLANSASFRSFCGAADVNAALAKIYHDAWPEPPSGDTFTLDDVKNNWPGALLFTSPERGWNYERDAAGTNNWAASGELVCILQQSYPVDDDNFPTEERNVADVDFRDLTGDIISELVDMSEQAGYLAATGFNVSGPFRTVPEERTTEAGDWLVMEIVIRWGNR